MCICNSVFQDSVYYSMDDQVAGVWAKIEPVVANATDGIDMVCYSQGI